MAKLHPIQRQGVLRDWKFPVTDGSGFNRNGLLEARDILLKAGYRYNHGQLLDLKGKPIHIEFLIHQEGLQRTLMPFVRNLKRLGIQISIRQVDVPQYIERKRNMDFDMTTDVMPQTLNPGNEQAQMWSSQSADEAGNYNYSGIKNPVIDAMIEQIIQAPNREQLVVKTRVLDRLLRAGYYKILTYGSDADRFAYWNMYQQPKVAPKLSLGLDYWWVDPQQAQKVERFLSKK